MTADPAQPYDYSEAKREILPSDNVLAQLAAFAMDQLEAEKEVARIEEELSKAKAKLTRISEVEIPALMDAAGMENYTTRDGIVVKVKETIRGSLPKDDPDKAFRWLAEEGHDDLIKRTVTVQFNKDEESWAKKFISDMNRRKKKLAYEVKRTIHPSTLASFVKGQLEAGVDFPMDIFGVYRQRASKIEVKEK